MTLAFSTRIQCEPVPWNRPRTMGGKRWFVPKKQTECRDAIAHQVRIALGGGPGFGTAALQVEITVIVPAPRKPSVPFPSRFDVDNGCKGVLDALNGLLWTDDRQIVVLVCSKRYTRPGEAPGYQLDVSALDLEREAG